MRRVIPAMLLAVVFLVDAGGSLAQVRPGGPPPGRGRNRLELEQRVMQGFAGMVRDRLGLDEAQISALQGVMQSFREDRQALNRSQTALRLRLRGAAVDAVSDEEAVDLLAQMIQVQEEELDLYRREQGELLRVLRPSQLVQFYQIREDFGQRVQQLRGGRGQGGLGGTFNPGGGTQDFLDWGGPVTGLR